MYHAKKQDPAKKTERTSASRQRKAGDFSLLGLERLRRAPRQAAAADVLQAQQTLGNQMVQRMLAGDNARDEQVADPQGYLKDEIAAAIQQKRGRSGAPLPHSVREEARQRLGHDFDDVRIHVDEEADQLSRSLQARAFTIGKDIFFKKEAFSPSSRRGRETLLHELTHVVQQRGKSASGRLKLDAPDSPQEKQAHTIGRGQQAAGVTPAKAAVVQTYREREDEEQLQQSGGTQRVLFRATPKIAELAKQFGGVMQPRNSQTETTPSASETPAQTTEETPTPTTATEPTTENAPSQENTGQQAAPTQTAEQTPTTTTETTTENAPSQESTSQQTAPTQTAAQTPTAATETTTENAPSQESTSQQTAPTQTAEQTPTTTTEQTTESTPSQESTTEESAAKTGAMPSASTNRDMMSTAQSVALKALPIQSAVAKSVSMATKQVKESITKAEEEKVELRPQTRRGRDAKSLYRRYQVRQGDVESVHEQLADDQIDQLKAIIKSTSSSPEQRKAAREKLQKLYGVEKSELKSLDKERLKALETAAKTGDQEAYEKWKEEKGPTLKERAKGWGNKVLGWGDKAYTKVKGWAGAGFNFLKDYLGKKKGGEEAQQEQQPAAAGAAQGLTVNVNAGGGGNADTLQMLVQYIQENERLKQRIAELEKQQAG